MTIQNIFHKIQIHVLFYVLLFVMTLTGHFKFFLLFMSFISIHELGHIFVSQIYKWKIDRIIILPFGGMTVFHEKINRPIKEELLIAISGVFFQTCFYFLVSTWIEDPLIRQIHYGLLFFNLLPIYPLDGAKILNCLLNLNISFMKSHTLTLWISVILLSFLCFQFHKNLLIIGTLFFLGIEIYKERKKTGFLFQKFLLERYLYSFPFIKHKKIKTIYKMKRDTIHTIVIDHKPYKEREILNKMFDK